MKFEFIDKFTVLNWWPFNFPFLFCLARYVFPSMIFITFFFYFFTYSHSYRHCNDEKENCQIIVSIFFINLVSEYFVKWQKIA